MSQLYRAKDRTYITEEEFSELYQFAVEVSRMIQGLVNYLKKIENDGHKIQVVVS